MSQDGHDYEESEHSFLECISALSKSFEAKAPSNELQDLFLKLAEKRSNFQDTINDEIINMFVTCIVQIANTDPNELTCFKVIVIFFKFLKHDFNVFTKFSPSKVFIRKLKLEKFLLNANEDYLTIILDFICFLLRYYEKVDYEDFSDLSTIISKIKRAEMHRIWVDTEDLVLKNEALESQLKQSQAGITSSFGEMFAGFDRMKRETTSVAEECAKQIRVANSEIPKMGKQIASLESTMMKSDSIEEFRREHEKMRKDFASLQTRMEERVAELENFMKQNYRHKIQELEESYLGVKGKAAGIESGVEYINTKIAKIEKTMADHSSTEENIESKIKSVKDQAEDNKRTLSTRMTTLEESVAAHFSQQANKTTSQMPSTNPNSINDTNVLLNKIQELQKKIDAIAAEKHQANTNPPPSNINISTVIPGLENHLKDLDARVKTHEQLLNDLKQKVISHEIDKSKVTTTTTTSPTTTSSTSNIAGSVELDKLKNRVDFINSYIQNLTSDIKDIKTNMHNGGGSQPFKEDINSIVRAQFEDYVNDTKKFTIHETEKIGTFMQEFINEQAHIKVKRIKLGDTTAREKMEALEWMARCVEFVSPNITNDMIKWCREVIYTQSQTALRTIFTSTKHNVDIVSSLVGLISESESSSNQNIRKLLEVYLKITEIALNSDSCLERGLSVGIIDILMRVLRSEKVTINDKKQGLRCLAITLRTDAVVVTIINNYDNLKFFLEKLQKPSDEEYLLVSTKLFRVAFRSPQNIDAVHKTAPEAFHLLMTNIGLFVTYSETVLEETLGAIKNYTQKPEYVEHIKQFNQLNPIVELANQKDNTKSKQFAISVLRNCSKVPNYQAYLKKMGFQDNGGIETRVSVSSFTQ